MQDYIKVQKTVLINAQQKNKINEAKNTTCN